MKCTTVFLMIVIGMIFYSSCSYQRVLLVDTNGNLVTDSEGKPVEVKGFGTIHLVFKRADGEVQTFSTDRGSVIWSQDGQKIFYQGSAGPSGYYHQGQGGYWYGGSGGYLPPRGIW